MPSSNLEGRHIALAAPPFCGHLHPLLGIALHLKSLGARCTVITGPNKIQRALNLGLAARPILTDQPNALENIADTDRRMTLNPLTMFHQVRENIKLIPKAMTEVQTIFEFDRPDALICDFTAFPVALVARSLGIPEVTVTPSPLAIENTDGVPSYFRGLQPGDTPFYQARDFAGRKLTRVVKKTFTLPFKRALKACDFNLYRPDGSETIYSEIATFGLGMGELEFDRSWPKNFQMVGPINYSPESNIKIDLRALSTKPLIFVTAGTHVWWAKKKLLDDTAQLRAAFPNYYFVYSLGDSHRASAEPIERNDKFAVFSYVPYDQHLASFRAVLHHAGSGILYQCIQFGIPALARPLDYDQFDYGARLHRRNLGVTVKSYNSPAAMAGLQKILKRPETFAMEDFRVRLQKYDPYGSIAATLSKIFAS